ncbi:MAG: 2-phospho-L-lactate guanylyltransferase [Anaerolineales bacterium]
MTLWAIIPAKSFQSGKSRLAKVLEEKVRAELNRQLLVHTLQVLGSLQAQIEQILVTSPDPAVLALARKHGARTIQEESSFGLNHALARATFLAQQRYTQGVLILPTDLPLLQREDIELILEHGRTPPVVIVVPDRHHRGTNALFISPPGLISYEFGENSFQRHCEQARAAGARLEILYLERLSLDLDEASDLALLHQLTNEQ